MENQKKVPDCCSPAKKYQGKNALMGIIYGLIPHIGCIMFIVGAILGATVLMQFFKPLLMSRYVFYYLILVSVGFATLSSILYLRKNKALSVEGIKNKKSYLAIMFGSTIGINLLLFFFAFPVVADITGRVASDEILTSSVLSISVDIPCPGHAPLITNELKTINGVKGADFSFPNKFDVFFDSTKTNQKEILSLDVFSVYPAKVLSAQPAQKTTTSSQQPFEGCCGSSGCGSSTTGVCGCSGR